MRIRTLAILSCALLAACESKPPPPPKRVELRQLTGNTLQLVSNQTELKYCLLYTLSEKGVVRQLTLNRKNESISCEAGKPIGNVAYRIPVEEGPVRVMVLFSDRPLNAGSIAQQIYESAATNPRFTALDLRLPGHVMTDTLQFTPSTEAPTQEGSVVGSSGTVSPQGGGTAGDNGTPAGPEDAGTPPGPQPAPK
jgi:hypothetical protein